jgi:hypothetical protein
MALKGELKDFSLTQLLNLINLARKTGGLTLTNRHGVVQLYFKQGRLVAASRDGEIESLPAMLLNAGKLSDEQARTIQARSQSSSDKEIGLLLVNAGYISQSDILQSIRKHMLDIVYPLFTWETGKFRFEQNELPGPEAVTAPIELENIILEGSRRLREYEMLQEEIPDMDAALRFAKRPASLRKISLSAVEWRVISFIDPRNSIGQIARQVSLSDFEIRKIVYGLLSAGLVEVVRTPPPAAPQPSTSAAYVAKTQKAKDAPPPVKRGIILRLIERIRRL